MAVQSVSQDQAAHGRSTSEANSDEKKLSSDGICGGDIAVSAEIPSAADIASVADLPIHDVDGKSHPFKSLYSSDNGEPKRVLILFIRHFFCGNCQEYIRTLATSIPPSSLLSIPPPSRPTLLIIGCGAPDLIPMYAATTSCPFPIYADPTRQLYDRLGMSRTLELGPHRPDYIKTSLVTNVVKSIYQGVMSGRGALRGGDYKQVGGEFLFEDGVVSWCHRMRNTRDHAEIAVLRRVLGVEA